MMKFPTGMLLSALFFKATTSSIAKVGLPGTTNMCDPPLGDYYKSFFDDFKKIQKQPNNQDHDVTEECELPLIDLSSLQSNNQKKRRACMEAVTKASSDWGFFQVLNHGISHELLGEMRKEQMKIFKMPFEKKVATCGLWNDSYRWGNLYATSVSQFSWSEAFHVPLAKIYDEDCNCSEFRSLRELMKKQAGAMSSVALIIAGILAENLGYSRNYFLENCSTSTCFLRLNRYPPCPFSLKTFGLTPHTDSDFLTIVYQDQVGGLQLMKDSKWLAVRPNPDALIVNIGDLFQAWSNNIYKSVKHKVMVNNKVDRYSIAYFLCPSYDFTIRSYKEPSLYKTFTFGEFRQQVQEDSKRTGHKVGLPRFLL